MMKAADKKALERYLKKLNTVGASNSVNIFESKDEQLARIDKGKKDYAYFVETYFQHYATDKTAAFQIKAANKIKKKKRIKAVLKWARGLGKSVHSDIFIPLWLWINGEMSFTLLISANETAAKTLLSDIQAEFEANDLLKHDFGEQVQHGSWEEGDFVLKDGTRFAARGRGQKLRGLRQRANRPDLIILDDIDDDELCENPKRVKKLINWVLKAVLGLGDKGNFRVIIANNLIAENSLTGHFSKQKGWWHFQVNALDKDGKPSWPEKYNKEYYIELEELLGYIAFQAEYMNNPLIEGDIFKEKETQWMEMNWRTMKSCQSVVGYWDVAYTANKSSDFNSVNVTGFKEKKVLIFKVFCRQTLMGAALDWMYEVDNEAEKKGVVITWYVEKQFWTEPVQEAIEAAAKRHGRYLEIVPDDTRKDNKLRRIIRMAFYWLTAKMFFNSKEKETYDMQTGLAQLYAIEEGYSGKDDYPDSLEGAISKGKKGMVAEGTDPLIGNNKKAEAAW